MSRNGIRSGLADPSRLEPIVDDDDDEIIKVVIETPKGSRNKYAFDPEERTFTLKKVLPAGMTFPYDFGFVPSTLAEDGDPVDVLVLMDEPEHGRKSIQSAEEKPESAQSFYNRDDSKKKAAPSVTHELMGKYLSAY